MGGGDVCVCNAVAAAASGRGEEERRPWENNKKTTTTTTRKVKGVCSRPAAAATAVAGI